MSIIRRIFKMKENDKSVTLPELNIEDHNPENDVEFEQLREPSLREQILSQPGFAAYAESVAEKRETTVESFSDQEVEALFEMWTDSKDKGFEPSSLTAMGIGVIGALALASAPAHASLGTQIAQQIIRLIEPFVRGLLNTAMSTLGVDISNGNDKIAIAAGQGVDAQNEVLKSIYNKEAARAAEPAPNECLSNEVSKRVVQSEETAKADIDDWIARDVHSNIYIRTSLGRAAQRIVAMRRAQDTKIYEAEGIRPDAPPARRVEALTKAASVTTFTSSTNMNPTERKKAEAHVAALFKDTAPKIDLSLEVDNPAGREVLDENVESEATLNHCKMIFERDIVERTGNDSRPSFRQSIAEKVASEYGSEEFAAEQRSITHAVPLLKTLVEQQSFANMMAVKTYEQQSELLKLQALQLKESVRQNLRS